MLHVRKLTLIYVTVVRLLVKVMLGLREQAGVCVVSRDSNEGLIKFETQQIKLNMLYSI